MRCCAKPEDDGRKTNPGKLERNQSPQKKASLSSENASAIALKGDPNHSVDGSASDPDSPRPGSPTTPVSPAGLQPTAELEQVGVEVSPAASLPTDLEPVGNVGGAQDKFSSVSNPEKFYKTGTEAEAAKAQFFLDKLESYSGDKTHFKGPPSTTDHDLSHYDLSEYGDQTRSTLESCRRRDLHLLEMKNLTHEKEFSDLTRSTDIKLFPAYDPEEYQVNRGHSKTLHEVAQLKFERTKGYKIQDGTDDRKKFGIYNRNEYLNTFFNDLAGAAASESLAAAEEAAMTAEEAMKSGQKTLAAKKISEAEEALKSANAITKAHVAQEAQTIKRHLIEDFRLAVSQAKGFIESTNFVPLGMSLMPVVSATGNSEKPYKLSLTAIDPDHIMATEGDAASDGIYSTNPARVTDLKTEMAQNLQNLYERTAQLLS